MGTYPGTAPTHKYLPLFTQQQILHVSITLASACAPCPGDRTGPCLVQHCQDKCTERTGKLHFGNREQTSRGKWSRQVLVILHQHPEVGGLDWEATGVAKLGAPEIQSPPRAPCSWPSL